MSNVYVDNKIVSKRRVYYSRVGLSDTQDWQFCGSVGTVEHFLLHFPRYYSDRVILQKSLTCLGVRDISVEVLLGGGAFSKVMKLKIN